MFALLVLSILTQTTHTQRGVISKQEIQTAARFQSRHPGVVLGFYLRVTCYVEVDPSNKCVGDGNAVKMLTTLLLLSNTKLL